MTLLGAISKLEGLSPLRCPQNFLQPPHVYPRIVCQLRVETAAEHVALAHCDDVLLPSVVVLLVLLQRRVLGGQRRHDLDVPVDLLFRQLVRRCLARCNDRLVPRLLLGLHTLGVWQYLLDNGRADEDASVGLVGTLICGGAEEREVEICLEALLLTAEVVPVDSHVEAADKFLSAFLGSIGALGKQDQASACAPGWPPLHPVVLSV